MEQAQVQILGLRTYQDPITGKAKIRHEFFNKKWRAASVAEALKKHKELLQKIPESEHFNLFFTVANCVEEPRKMAYQKVIPFDCDGVEADDHDAVIKCFLHETSLKYEQVGIICSGNGLQFFVEIKEPIASESYFHEMRGHYKGLINQLNEGLKKRKKSGEFDPSVFSASRLMRLPGTTNFKKDKGEKEAYAIQTSVRETGFELTSFTPVVEPKAAAKPNAPANTGDRDALRAFPTPDTKGVLSGCGFLKWAKNNPKEVKEPQWYAMLSILPHLKNGRKLSHDYSKDHPGYHYEETEQKIEQALSASAPRTCGNINTLWDSCHKCPHFGKVTSPITIQSEDYIKTIDTGFRVIGKNGPGRVEYSDLVKYYKREHDYYIDERGATFLYDGKKWAEEPRIMAHVFAEKNIKPDPTSHEVTEFIKKLTRTNVKTQDELDRINDRLINKINLNNGVVNIKTGEFMEHSKEFMFHYVLPFDYDSTAECPRFEKFLDEVTQHDVALQHMILEYIGYGLSGTRCWAQKALLLYGTGANGKSVLIDVINALAGDKNVSVVNARDIVKPESRALMMGKLMNLSEETPKGAFTDSSIFKDLVSGGKVAMRKLYENSISVRNKTKLIFSCNSLPYSHDDENAFFRRFLYAPFTARFDGDNADLFLTDKLKEELPGIFNLVMKNYRNLLERGKFEVPEISVKYQQNHRIQNNEILEWLYQECEFDPNAYEDSERMYQLFIEDTGSKLNKRWFGRKIKEIDGVNTAQKGSGKQGTRKRVIAGVRYKNHDEVGEGDDF